MSDSSAFSRRTFCKLSLAGGISAYIAPWGNPAFASLFEEKLLTPAQWDPKTHHTAYRIDGIAKVTGNKVFARDIRAQDMPHWPKHQAHALILRIPRANRIFTGIDLQFLGSSLQPDKIITAKDLARDSLVLPSFYGGEPLLAIGQSALYLGHPVAILIYQDFMTYTRAKALLKFNEKFLRYGATVPLRTADPYGSFRFVRIGGPTPQAPDIYSSVKDTEIFGYYHRYKTLWPMPKSAGKLDEQGMRYASAIQKSLEHPPDDWLVFSRRYFSQSIETAAMEGDNSNGWYDANSQNLHLVVASQSPLEVAQSIAEMAHRSRFKVKQIFVHPCPTVGYGSKDHSIFPMYGFITTLYSPWPVRLANDRYEQFQSTMKRHAFDIERTIAVNRKTGKFQILRSSIHSDGGGRANFSASIAACAATSAQGIYYFPKNDVDTISVYSRAVEAGSVRGYGSLESMTPTEMMVDEIAEILKIDAIELRLKNALKSGDYNSQGVAPGGAERIVEALEQARDHPLWQQRHSNKKRYNAQHPGMRYGVGYACVQKNFGSGSEASFAKVTLDAMGKITLSHSSIEIGTGMSSSQAVNCAKWLGEPAHEIHTALLAWPELPMTTSGDPYTVSQAQQDRLAQDPYWTPALAAPASASNSSYFSSHTTQEACRLIFLYGLWPAALSIWQHGLEGGPAASYVVRVEDARWTPDGLTANGMEAIPLSRLAAIAHQKGLVTGAMVHAFNRWQWSEATFPIQGQIVRLPLDGVSLRYGKRHFSMIKRQQLFVPPLNRNFAGVTYYSVAACLAEIAVEIGTGRVQLIHHHHWLDCGKPIVPQLVLGQLEGGLAMGVGHALYEYLPLYEEGPGNGTWNFNRYLLPRASDVAVWNQTHTLLPPLSQTDPSKGIAEVVSIPIIAAVVNAIYHATGQRFYELPVTAEKIREKGL